MTALDQLTPAQYGALIATAERTLRDPEELASELLQLLYIDPSEGRAQAAAGVESTVKDDLTGACDLSIAPTETFAVSFSTAPPN